MMIVAAAPDVSLVDALSCRAATPRAAFLGDETPE
jgi:hypothetical protein